MFWIVPPPNYSDLMKTFENFLKVAEIHVYLDPQEGECKQEVNYSSSAFLYQFLDIQTSPCLPLLPVLFRSTSSLILFIQCLFGLPLLVIFCLGRQNTVFHCSGVQHPHFNSTTSVTLILLLNPWFLTLTLRKIPKHNTFHRLLWCVFTYANLKLSSTLVLLTPAWLCIHLSCW